MGFLAACLLAFSLVSNPLFAGTIIGIDALTGRLLFKGGTSLSKIFRAINRFSEDIDLAVDYVALGFKGELDPRREGISKTKRAGILDEMMTECHLSPIFGVQGLW